MFIIRALFFLYIKFWLRVLYRISKRISSSAVALIDSKGWYHRRTLIVLSHQLSDFVYEMRRLRATNVRNYLKARSFFRRNLRRRRTGLKYDDSRESHNHFSARGREIRWNIIKLEAPSESTSTYLARKNRQDRAILRYAGRNWKARGESVSRIYIRKWRKLHLTQERVK